MIGAADCAFDCKMYVFHGHRSSLLNDLEIKMKINYSFTKATLFKILFSLSLVFSIDANATDITPESMVGTGGCSATGTDAACWQAAINASPHFPVFGTIAGSSGKQYLINDTIVICNASDGVIDGHDAQLYWTGGAGKPMFLIIGSNHIRFKNLMIQANTPAPLDSAFEFTSSNIDHPYASPTCPGTQKPSSKNSIEHVTVEGTNPNVLNYGVRFSNRFSYSFDGNNDMSTIIDSNFYTVMKAAISIEHSQSHQHRFISVNGYGASGNTGCFVSATTGFFASTGGFQGSWGKANFCIDNAYGTFDIIESNSEGSNRLLVAGNNAGDNTGYPVSVNIQGGRFAVNGLNSDGNLISFNRQGPISIRGLHIDGTSPSGVQAAISIQPGQPSHTPASAASAIIEAVSFFTPNSYSWNTLKVKSWVNLITQGNVCDDSSGYAVACAAALRN